jgi:ribose 5-phosphate isomerase B
MPLRVAVGADHGGFIMKNELVTRLQSLCTLVDVGAQAYEADDDYPGFARKVAQMVASGEADRGIIICGSGVGACVAANKVPGARACLCHDCYSAHQGVEHDDMNVLCLGARVVGVELAFDLAQAFLSATFLNAGRYLRRVKQIVEIESSVVHPR